MRTRRLSSSSYPMPFRHRDVVQREASHISVLSNEILTGLEIRETDTVLDATLGGAGHARLMCERLGKQGIFLGIDADNAALARAEVALKGVSPRVILRHGNFRNLASIVQDAEISALDKALFDLGWSGFQLAEGKGFSFLADEPLLMTYGEPGENVLTAREIVNTWEEESLVNVFDGWGEEAHARRIARGIVEARREKPIETARELAEVIRSSVPVWYRKGSASRRMHPATKTFQALRIAVNDEMGALKEGISAAWGLLRKEGRLAVITFHSVEDREVKRLFREFEAEGGVLTPKKPLKPSREELRMNPRARSAKLRIIQKH